MIIVTSLHRDFLPSSWWQLLRPPSGTTRRSTAPSASSCSSFSCFVRFLPMISIYEVRELLPYLQTGWRRL